MKKVLILAVAIVLVAAGVSFAAIADSKHDLTSTTAGYSGATLSSCQYCHTPHLRGNTVVTGAPLWNRTLSADGSWTMYGTTLGGTATTNPGPNSKTCLSCHDGSIAVGSVLVGSGGTIAGTNLTAGSISSGVNANLGVDLTQEHPIGFSFVTDRGGVPTITTPFKLYSGTFECASCHDPHETTNTPFLRAAKSTICTDCHSAK
jgi:predicted CXXCH cytochrome family protein